MSDYVNGLYGRGDAELTVGPTGCRAAAGLADEGRSKVRCSVARSLPRSTEAVHGRSVATTCWTAIWLWLPSADSVPGSPLQVSYSHDDDAIFVDVIDDGEWESTQDQSAGATTAPRPGQRKLRYAPNRIDDCLLKRLRYLRAGLFGVVACCFDQFVSSRGDGTQSSRRRTTLESSAWTCSHGITSARPSRISSSRLSTSSDQARCSSSDSKSLRRMDSRSSSASSARWSGSNPKACCKSSPFEIDIRFTIEPVPARAK